MKTSYHPAILVAFYLNCLPGEWLHKIPSSTKYDWRTKNLTLTFGHEWYYQNQHIFSTLKGIAVSKKLLKINRALLRIIAIQRFLKKYAAQIHEKVFNAAATALHNIKKVQNVLGFKPVLKLLQFTYRQYWVLKQKTRCKKSLLNRCLPKHPAQLMQHEVSIIKKYSEDIRFIHWPLSSVYHQIIRDGVTYVHISTFYKYAALLNLKRHLPKHRRKNHSTGIRAAAPLQLIHADVTVLRTADNIKAYIYLLQDNFSRALLRSFVSLHCKAEVLFEQLQKVQGDILQPAGILHTQLMTDDGSENFGIVQEFLSDSQNPAIQHIIAQKDVEFSNSMIEAANKNLKYRFLYHKHIANYGALCKYVQQAVDDYNNRPHDVLNGLTPLEVLKGKTLDKKSLHKEMLLAKAARINQNKNEMCCSFSF